MPEIGDSDFPALFRASDDYSKISQKIYIRQMLFSISLIASAAIAGSISFQFDSAKLFSAYLTAFLTGGGLILTFYISSQKTDRDWYDGRAVAESIKTKSWRYMMHSDPYHVNTPGQNADDLFISTIEAIKDQRANLVGKLNPIIASEKPITDKMRHIRQLDLNSRRAIYLIERLEDQKIWYANKSASNRSLTRKWFNLVILAQFLGFLASILAIAIYNVNFNFVGIIMSLAAAAMTWLQIKRYQELSNSYNLAAQEISIIIEKGRSVNDSVEFGKFVSDAETAISREHTMWVARRDNY